MSSTNSSRQVGMKAKREEDEEDDVEWEEAPIGGETLLFFSMFDILIFSGVYIFLLFCCAVYKYLDSTIY